MNLPAINPKLNATVHDHSMVDDSIKQDGVTISAGANSILNMNSGNGRASKGMSALMQVMFVSVICDLIICAVVIALGFYTNFTSNQRHFEVQAKISEMTKETNKTIEQMQELANKVQLESKEGTIWILRRDILNSIDYHESTKKISSKQYKRIKDQFEYYKSIGGNHDVEGRFDDFKVKVFGTQEIIIVPENEK